MLKNEIIKELQLKEVSYLDSLLTTGFDEPYDHSIDTIDPDEPTDLPGITVTDGSEPTETEWLEQKAELALGV